MDRVYITDESKTFAVREEWDDRFPRYYINRLDEGKRYLYASMGTREVCRLVLMSTVKR